LDHDKVRRKIMEVTKAQAATQVSDIEQDSDLSWVPEAGDGKGEGAIAEYYEAESWQFSGCGD